MQVEDKTVFLLLGIYALSIFLGFIISVGVPLLGFVALMKLVFA